MFYYFGYGSNLNLTSLRAKGVEPLSSEKAILHDWKLAFNVRHWFRHEGGVGNIIPAENSENQVHGMLHLCEDEHLPLLDAVEAYGTGYDRIDIEVETDHGMIKATTYVGMPGYLDDNCLPTRRYLNIILKGATEAGLDEAYIEKLRQQPLNPVKEYPPFQHPDTEREFNEKSLSEHPLYTALGGAVFDMQHARSDLHCLFDLFGGKDMTLFHLKRHDTSDGTETLEDVKQDRISEAGRKYLNAYLHEYDREFRYVGRYTYD
ncbi:MAG: gamma-glutamylcyclotransferase family protein [Gammaproteobacteria bacterium]|nr:gamma-glutamylcyclotransferase family protein [Gammaproteobacteria bacterium]